MCDVGQVALLPHDLAPNYSQIAEMAKYKK